MIFTTSVSLGTLFYGYIKKKYPSKKDKEKLNYQIDAGPLFGFPIGSLGYLCSLMIIVFPFDILFFKKDMPLTYSSLFLLVTFYYFKDKSDSKFLNPLFIPNYIFRTLSASLLILFIILNSQITQFDILISFSVKNILGIIIFYFIGKVFSFLLQRQQDKKVRKMAIKAVIRSDKKYKSKENKERKKNLKKIETKIKNEDKKKEEAKRGATKEKHQGYKNEYEELKQKADIAYKENIDILVLQREKTKDLRISEKKVNINQELEIEKSQKIVKYSKWISLILLIIVVVSLICIFYELVYPFWIWIIPESFLYYEISFIFGFEIYLIDIEKKLYLTYHLEDLFELFDDKKISEKDFENKIKKELFQTY